MLGSTLRTSYFTGIIGRESPFISMSFLMSEKILNQININKSLQIRTITNINPNRSFLKKYFDKNILYINKNVTSTMNNKDKIDSVFMAKQFIETLTQDERKIIMEQLTIAEKENSLNLVKLPDQSNITFRHLLVISLQSGLPFIGFGFVDNFIMIVAGDIIEKYIGFFLPISTMAAAGLGNAFSDVAGIGLAHRIEIFCSKLINAPKLSAEDWNRPIIHWCQIISKSICIFLGCLIGMTPLLFLSRENDETKKKSSE